MRWLNLIQYLLGLALLATGVYHAAGADWTLAALGAVLWADAVLWSAAKAAKP